LLLFLAAKIQIFAKIAMAFQKFLAFDMLSSRADGKDIDLLATLSYTFEAKHSASRFVLVFRTSM
jgi:hypothetical protein